MIPGFGFLFGGFGEMGRRKTLASMMKNGQV